MSADLNEIYYILRETAQIQRRLAVLEARRKVVNESVSRGDRNEARLWEEIRLNEKISELVERGDRLLGRETTS